MSYFHYGYEACIDRLIEACVRKFLADPEEAGVYSGTKSGRIPLADWKAWLLCVAAEKSAVVLAYEANPIVAELKLGGETLLIVDFRVTTANGSHLVAFDSPGLRRHDMALLLGLATSALNKRLVHITDDDLDAFVETGSFPLRSTAASVLAASSAPSAPPPLR